MRIYLLGKRLLDFAVAAGLLVLVAPLWAALALMVGITLGRPIHFRQMRPGLGGTLFPLLKLRTMRPCAPGQDAVASDGQRLTGVGRWMRRWSLDELPTLWNVLRGHMSLVGPRPLLPQYLERYSPRQARRHEVQPGITGWAQVHGRNAMDWEERLELDVWYVEHRSFLLDLRILVRTLGTVLGGRGVESQKGVPMSEFRPNPEVPREY